jgi:NADH-quinone oxidoreductase subunit M
MPDMHPALPLLSLLIWIPIAGGVVVMILGASAPRRSGAEAGREEAGTGREPAVRWVSLATSLATLLLSIPLFAWFDRSTYQMQFVELLPWIPVFDINYHLGVDGISMPLVVLTAFMTVLVVIAGWQTFSYKLGQYMAAFLIMEGMMIGVFCALDGILFYVFWEGMLIPMFLIIGIWGGPRRIYAALKFFLYTFFGSVLFLVALIYLYFQTASFEILDFHVLKLGLKAQTLLFFAFLIAFAVKIPMWPVHTWLPDAHVEAPTGGSVILAAIMLKMGGYGLARFTLPILPDASANLDWLIIGLSLIAIVYIALVALVQEDMKKLIAYSSISHMGFVTLGFFVIFTIYRVTGDVQGAAMGVEGGLVQMISHGFVSGALFLCVGVMYDRVHSREISAYGGVVNTMPRFAALMVLFALANAGLPGTSGFVGEFMVILSAFKANFWYALLAATILVLGASYTLWMVKRVIFGKVANERVAALTDLNARETITLGASAVAVLLIGVWPNPLVDVMHASVDHLLTQALVSKL